MVEEYKQVDRFIISNTIIGQGQFGTVHKGFFRDDYSKEVAVKIISLKNVQKEQRFLKNLKNEISILQKIKNNYIVKLYHATRTANNLYMFLEFCGEGDLKELLKKRGGRLTESEAVQYFRQICEGFKTLYEQNIIHRDIKPANILIKEGKALISDFGFARCLEQCGMEEQTQKTYLGTPLYMAPQILNEEKFSSKCDVWSLGMLFYEILYGQTPWTAPTSYKLFKNIKTQPLKFPEFPQTSSLVKDMLQKMLVFDDDSRISWSELFNHPLIKLEFDDIQSKINEISNNEADPLLKSVEVNAFYCDKNKVLGIDKRQQLKAFQQNKQEKSQQEKSQSQSNSEMQPSKTQEIDVTNILEVQKAQQETKKKIILIDSYFTFERNLGIFVNLTTNYIFRVHQKQVFKIPQHLFFRIIFVLQKKQLIKFRHLLDIMEGKVNPDKDIYNKDELVVYQKSAQYNETKQIIETDNGYVQPYFKEIYGRTSTFLSQQSGNDANIQKFFSILNEDLNYQNPEFEVICNETLDEFLKTVKQGLPSVTENRRELLHTIYYVFLCKNPYQVFEWKENDNDDFHQFYDQHDHMSEQELSVKVEQCYKQLN